MVSKGSYKGSALSPSKAPGFGAKYNSNRPSGGGRPSGAPPGKNLKGTYPIDKTPKKEVGKGRGSSGQSMPRKAMIGMFGKGDTGKVSSTKKRFNKVSPTKKSFGFGRQQKQGMKGSATQYGSA